MRLKSLLLGLCLLPVSWLASADPASCKTVRMGMVEWTDLEVTTTTAQVMLETLGYDVTITTGSVGGVYEEMAQNNVDAFLGNWMPANAGVIGPYLESGKLEVLDTNLNGALYTLAVPKYVYDQGVTTVADIAKHADEFGYRIYGLEKGNGGNLLIQDMIDKNDFGLGKFSVLETSERLMLAQVKGKTKKGQWIAFLAWAPHPMNVNYDIEYLDGADAYFGPDKGAAHVRTVVRSGYTEQCPNVNQLLKNMTFSLEMEEKVMDQVMNGFVPTKRAVRIWMNDNAATLTRWLDGVKTFDGQTPNGTEMAEALAVGWGRLKD
ncbi:choline ABC transporter substrate-binding protein [Oceanobacter kriegii]|uniref:choline ABC transporter substrate-binding protein n=1 Tax=Oceanobacter kriegii TaxID=64972 RepID=UPI0004899DF9|nr:choline ABC transporter substrate-binding protein [Oceanobacter kriegii]